MKITTLGGKPPVELKFEDLVINQTYVLANEPKVVFLCGGLLVGDGGYNSRTVVKKAINLVTGHIYSSLNCGHMRFIHVNAEVVL